MKRPLALLVLFVSATSAAAQAPPEPIKLTLPPAAEPVPALKYPLLPELSEQTPGNAVQLYYRAFSPDWWGNLRTREMSEKVDNATRASLAQLKDSDLRFLLDYSALREVDRAARREYCDWDMPQRLREQGIGLLLPDVQAMRMFATFLAARARLEIAEGQLDKAIYTLRTGFALARHVSDGPTLIQALVGNAIAAVMMTQLEELLQQPGAPNLYWALTDLPRPFIDLRKAIQGEKLWLHGTFPELRGLDSHSSHLSPDQREQLQKVAEKIIAGLLGQRQESSPGARLVTIARVASAYPEAKRALIAAGHKPEEVEVMPAVQAVLLESLRDYDRLRDEQAKWMALPYPEARAGLERAQKAISDCSTVREGIPLARTLLPQVLKVYDATTRLDRRLAALRCVEALRLYAAAHDGRLPAALAHVTEVPVPADPMTGKPFEYKVSGDTATLSAGPPPGEAATGYNTLAYEITLRK